MTDAEYSARLARFGLDASAPESEECALYVERQLGDAKGTQLRTKGIDINTLALTGGLSLPSFVPGTRLDINMEVGARGTTEQNLVRDVFYGVSVILNIGERWFVKRKLR